MISKRDTLLVLGALLLIGIIHVIINPHHNPIAILGYLRSREAIMAAKRDCSNSQNASTFTVSFNGERFNPESVVTTACDVLRIVNESDVRHQPAVGPHPSHYAFSEFEAKKPPQRGETFTVLLNRVGQYSFHDHLHPKVEGNLAIREREMD